MGIHTFIVKFKTSIYKKPGSLSMDAYVVPGQAMFSGLDAVCSYHTHVYAQHTPHQPISHAMPCTTLRLLEGRANGTKLDVRCGTVSKLLHSH
jgi:hypothetical protein